MNDLDYLKELEFLRIENRGQYLIKQPHHHPASKQYKEFKIKEIKKCIYGLWGKESGGYRWMPPQAYFYANYVWIKQDNEKKEQVVLKPSFDDLEWMLFYMYTECYGFSGFELDEEYSCDNALIDKFELSTAKNNSRRWSQIHKPDGSLKEYVKPQDYLHRLHKKELGKPLWNNDAKDAIILGSRSSGKSYGLIGLTLWFMCLDGAKSFSKDFSEMKVSANVIMGSADDVSKKNFLIGLEDGMNYLLTEEDLGVYKYKTRGLEDVPLMGRHMLGKTNNFWRYRFIENGLESGGSGSSFSPIAYSPNKKGGGATAAASRRVHLSIVDEVGKLQVSAIAVWGSNRSLTKRTTKFGVQVFAGTSGNMDLIQEAKKMFQNPKDFNMVSFSNIYEKNSNEIGFFIPAFLSQRQFKDENGNTNVTDAVDYFLRERENSKTSEKLNEDKMNYPLIPEDMWITKESSILPREEAKAVKRRLLTNDLYKKKRTFIRMNWDSTKASGVDYKIINEENAIKLDTFRETQGTNEKKNRGSKSTECDIIVYEFPEANAPNDLYKFGGLDPYVAEELEDGESLGSFYLLKNPKYISEGISGDIIVAEITGKYSGRAEYNERVEKLMALYGNPNRSIMFESDRGDDLKEYFMKKNKEYLLAPTPVKYEDNKMVMKTKQTYGFSHGNQIGKLHNLTQLKEWLLEETTINGETLRNIERITSIGLLDEIIEYDWDLDKAKKANYDRISAFLGCIIARRENYNQLTKNEKPENTKGILADFAKKGIISKLQNKLKWQNSYTTGKYQT